MTRGAEARTVRRRVRLRRPSAWGDPDQHTVAETSNYGTAEARACERLHPEVADRWTWLIVACYAQLGVQPVQDVTVEPPQSACSPPTPPD